MLLLQQVERKLAIVEIGQLLGVDPDEGIHGPRGRQQLQEAAFLDRAQDRAARLIEPPSRTDQLLDALVAAERRLHCPLPDGVAA